MTNKKEIQIFDKNVRIFTVILLLKHRSNPSTIITLLRNFNITAPIIYKDTVKEVLINKYWNKICQNKACVNIKYTEY